MDTMKDLQISCAGMAGFRHFSIMNPWLDFVVLTPKNYAEAARNIIHEAMDAYWDYEYECYGDAIEGLFIKYVVPFVIVFHDSEDESAEYEAEWEKLISQLNYEDV